MTTLWTLTRLNLRLQNSRGALCWLVVAVMLLSTIAFQALASSGDFVQDLQVRLLYGAGLGYALSVGAVMLGACFAVRQQLDARNVHQLTALPASRPLIWGGMFLAQWLSGGLLLLALWLSLAGNLWWSCRGLEPERRAEILATWMAPKALVTPICPDDMALTSEFVTQRGGRMQRGMPTEVLIEMRYQAVAHHQSIEPGREMLRSIACDRRDFPQADARLRLRLLSETAQSSAPVSVGVYASADGTGLLHQARLNGPTLAWQTIIIPADSLPREGEIFVRIRNESSGTVGIHRRDGLMLELRRGSLPGHVAAAASLQMLHLAAVAACGLACGLAVTFATAAFASLSLFLLGLASGVFAKIANQITFTMEASYLPALLSALIKGGLILIGGLRPPPLLQTLASGCSPDWAQIGSDWTWGTVLYLLVIAALGILVLQRKELSRLEV